MNQKPSLQQKRMQINGRQRWHFLVLLENSYEIRIETFIVRLIF